MTDFMYNVRFPVFSPKINIINQGMTGGDVVWEGCGLIKTFWMLLIPTSRRKKKIFGEGLQARLAYLVYTAYTGRTLHIKRSILCSYNEDTCVTYE